MNKLDFSVSMCVYGGDNADYFREALESIFNQTVMPTEIVLVVDGPIPSETESVIAEFANKTDLLKVIRLKENVGHGNARRIGFEACLNDLIAIADADDINVSDRFEKQIEKFIDDPDLSAVSTNCYHFTHSIDDVINEEKLPTSDSEIKKYMKKRCPFCQPSVMLSKKAVDAAGGYLDWYLAEDYYLWVRMYLNGGKFANIPEGLLYLRTTEAQALRRGGYKYFKSMAKLYKYMYDNKIIGFGTYLFDVASRFLIQVLMPNKMRAFIRKKLM